MASSEPTAEMAQTQVQAVAPPPKRRWWPFGRQQQAQKPTTAIEMLKTALDVRKQTVVVIQNIEREVVSTNEVGEAIAQTLQQDRERLQRMQRSHQKAAPLTQAALSHTGQMMRGVARNKCFMFLFGCVLILAIVVIILSGVAPGRQGQAKSNFENNVTINSTNISIPLVTNVTFLVSVGNGTAPNTTATNATTTTTAALPTVLSTTNATANGTAARQREVDVTLMPTLEPSETPSVPNPEA